MSGLTLLSHSPAPRYAAPIAAHAAVSSATTFGTAQATTIAIAMGAGVIRWNVSPVATIPTNEMWLWQNAGALASVHRGIADARAGRMHDLGSFAQYANDDSADD